jgi:hypothetical protein
MADSTMYDAFLAKHEQGIPFTSQGDSDDGSTNEVPAAG